MRTTLLIFNMLLISKLFSQTGVISGKLLSLKTSKPISFTYVSIKSLKKFAQTDVNGDFIFRDLPASNYKLLVSPLGFDSKEFEVQVKADSNLSFVIYYPDTCFYEASKNNRKCPICHKKNKVIPIVYGLPIGELDEDNYYYAGCEVTNCDPNWYCKRDKTKF